MNFLAHCLIGHPDRGLIAGGYIGDFIKGPVPDSLPPELHLGVRLHRRVDGISNLMPEMRVSYPHFGPKLRRAAPVLLDVIADHCLALEWETYGHDDLTAFTALCYGAIADYPVPERGQRLFSHMVDTDLLARYRDPIVVYRGMANVLARLRFDLADELDGLLQRRLEDFQTDFRVYFPILQRAANQWLESQRS